MKWVKRKKGSQGQATQLPKDVEWALREDPEALGVGMDAARHVFEQFESSPPYAEWLAGLAGKTQEEAFRDGREFLELLFQPLNPAMTMWANSPIADDPSRFEFYEVGFRRIFAMSLVSAWHRAAKSSDQHMVPRMDKETKIISIRARSPDGSFDRVYALEVRADMTDAEIRQAAEAVVGKENVLVDDEDERRE